MARADFYILKGAATSARFSCSIANKAWSQGNSVYIMVNDTDEAHKIDDLLWTYQDVSFLPHARIDELDDRETSVVIGWPGTTPLEADVIINLTESVPECVTQYQRVIEIVAENSRHRDQGRQRYKRYREMGFDMFNHNINLEQ